MSTNPRRAPTPLGGLMSGTAAAPEQALLNQPFNGDPTGASATGQVQQHPPQAHPSPAAASRRAEDDDKEDDDDDEKEDTDDEKGDSASNFSPRKRAIRGLERSRIRSIMESDVGKANPTAARSIALHTSMPRSEAIAMLAALGPEVKPGAGLYDRMNGQPAGLGPSDPAQAENARQATALAIVNAGRKARGEKPLAQIS